MRSGFFLLAVTIMASLLLHRNLARPLGVGLISHALFMNSSLRKSNCDGIIKASTSTLALSENPLLKKEGTPLFREIKAEHVVPAIEHDLSELKRDFKAMESELKDPKKTPSYIKHKVSYEYDGVVEKLEKIQAPLSYSWGVVNHLMGVKNSDALRKAHETMQPAIIDIYQQMGQSEVLFRAFHALQQEPGVWSSLDGAQKRIVEAALKQMKASGVDLEPSKRAEFNRIQLELAELSTKYSNNLLDSTKQFKLKLTNPAQVEGLPLSTKAMAAQNAKAQGETNATAEQGPWVITLDIPCYLPVMQHLKDRAIREQVYRAYITRASSGDYDNAPLISRILTLKTQLAQLLGYNCFAEKSLNAKMADSVDSVMSLIEMLRVKSLPAAQRDLQAVREFAATEMGFKDGELQLWDIPYYSERLRERSYQYSEEELRAYFAFPQVLQGLFQLAHRLFGVDIIEQPVTVFVEGQENNTKDDKRVQVWHEDVKYYSVLDATTKEEIAGFYLDPYSRPAEKRGGAWMDVCLGKSKVLHRKPVAYLTCNGSPPVKDSNTPSLMTFREVETLFHEFGHGLQHMLTRVEHGDAAGISGVEWDAVELPSQFMENWCYDEQTLYSFAKHYQTGEPLPLELFEKIKNAKNFQAGMQMLRQLFFGAMDMYLHSSQYITTGEHKDTRTPFQVQHELAPLYTVIPPLPEDRFLCSFSHIFAGGYSAGYYSYKWAEVMSADAFAAFEELGLKESKDNAEIEAKIQAKGRLFRETVLAKGGGTHPSEVYRAFRGRDPSPEALLRHSGLAK